MPQLEPLSAIKPLDLDNFVKTIQSSSDRESEEAGLALVKDAARFGLSVRDYLKLSVGSEKHEGGLDGYERTLYALNLPVKDSFEDGIYLQAASETFQTHAGTRALFPEVIDDMLRWTNRQDPFEVVEPMLANSRTMNGNELLSTVVDDDSAERDTFSVPELGRIPVRSIRTSEQTIKIYKHGSALRTSYEFSRRASLDLMVPYANRIARELELFKVTAATNVLINGDGLNGAATEVDQSTYDASTGATSTAGQITWENLLYWFVQRAKANAPVDTAIMNWDGWFQWLMLFAAHEKAGAADAFGDPKSESLARAGATIGRDPVNIVMSVRPVLSSATPANKIIGITVGETLEELVEAGSDIQEQERNILNQSITMTKTENTGYRLVYGDTRSIYDFGN